MKPELSQVTEKYLKRFDEILRELIGSLGRLPVGRSLGRVFMNQLIPLHGAAGEMCHNLLQYTTCLPLEKRGVDIMAWGQKSVEDLTALLQQGQGSITGEAVLMRYLRRSRQVLDNMVYRMGSARTTNDMNANFMRQMIPLQQGIETLCHTALELGLGGAVGQEGERQLQQAETMGATLRTLLSVAEGC